MELPSSRDFTGKHPRVTKETTPGNRGKLHFHPLISHLSNKEFTTTLQSFMKAVQERKATRVGIKRLIIAVSAYDPATPSGGVIRLTLDGDWVEIHPVDFLVVLLDCIHPGDPSYDEITKVLKLCTPHRQQGDNRSAFEYAEACLQSLAAIHRSS